MTLSKKRIRALLKKRNKIQTKKRIKKRVKLRKGRNYRNSSFRKKKYNIRNSSIKNYRKPIAKKKRKAYIRGGGSPVKLDYLHTELFELYKDTANDTDDDTTDKNFYNFTFIKDAILKAKELLKNNGTDTTGTDTTESVTNGSVTNGTDANGTNTIGTDANGTDTTGTKEIENEESIIKSGANKAFLGKYIKKKCNTVSITVDNGLGSTTFTDNSCPATEVVENNLINLLL